MKTTTAPKQHGREFSLTINNAKRPTNFLPIQAQIQFANMARKHDKRNTRNKQKAWRREY